MDDYILALLLEQQEREPEPEHAEEVVQQKLTERLVLGNRSERQKQKNLLENRSFSNKAKSEKADGSIDFVQTGRREETLQQVWEGIRQAEALVVPAYARQREIWRGVGAEIRSGGEETENGAAIWKSGLGTEQSTMGPETLSMYFQRDARRYS